MELEKRRIINYSLKNIKKSDGKTVDSATSPQQRKARVLPQCGLGDSEHMFWIT